MGIEKTNQKSINPLADQFQILNISRSTSPGHKIQVNDDTHNHTYTHQAVKGLSARSDDMSI